MIRYEEIRRLHIEISSKCNAACVRCPRNVDGGFKIPGLVETEFTIEKFKQTFPLDFLKQLNSILFCGDYGDAGTCKDLNKILEYIKNSNKNIAITLTTNGSVRTPQFWIQTANILNPTIDIVRWSIDGLEDTNHLYRKNTVWSKIIENARAFINAGGTAHWDFLIFGYNEHQIDHAETLAKQLGFKKFYKKKALGFLSGKYSSAQIHSRDKNGKYQYSIDAPSEDNLNIISKKEQITPEIKDVSLNDFLNEFNYYKQTVKNKTYPDYIVKETTKKIDCSAIRNKEIYVDASGGVHPCCYLGHASQQNATGFGPVQYLEWIQENVGLTNINCFNKSIRDIVNSDYFNKIKNTWDANNILDGKILQCARHCSVTDNIMQSMYDLN